MRKRFSCCLIFCFLFLSISACSSGEKVDETLPVIVETTETVPEQKEAEVTTPEAIETEDTAEQGKQAEDDFSLPYEGMRPVAVMIDNQGSKVLPQGGLDRAQIVYEVIVEGGLTRLMPIFWGTKPEMIGPVRSARDYFLDYIMEYDAIYVHVGGSPQSVADIKKLNINDVDGMRVGNDVIWDLTKDKGNWQDSYTSMEALLNYALTRKYKTTTDRKFPFTYSTADILPESGQPAMGITLKYPSMTTKYEYDGTTGTYKRLRQGKAHIERVSGKQLEAENIIIQFVPNYDIKGDKAGRQEMNTTGSGNGYFITSGKAIKLKWTKESRNAQTKYSDESGKPIQLNRGQTWIQIMPMTAKVTIE